MKNTLLLLMIPVVLTTAFGCKDNEEEGCMDPVSVTYNPDATKDDGSCEYGGQGGNAEFDIYPQFNGHAVWNTDVYPDTALIKFNAIASPGTNPALYDMVISGNLGENHLHAFDMKKGKYYIHVSGWDTTVNRRVSGGMPVTVTQESGVVNMVIPMY